MIGKRGVSPLIATFLLIAFAVALGAVVMSWGESYIEAKAEFVGGNQESSGCEAVDWSVVLINGVPQACLKEGAIEILFDNQGPTIADVSSRVIGSKGLSTAEGGLQQEIPPGSAGKAVITIGDIGEIKQVKITPKIFVDGMVESCLKAPLLVEQFTRCE